MSNKNKNKNKKAKNKSNKFKRNLSLDVTYYTEEAYMKCFPEATLEDYCRSIFSIDHSILQAEKMNNCNISNVRLVVIDEEYFEWIEENMLENSRAKLKKKNVDMIVANNLKQDGAGFGGDTNIVTLITESDEVQLEKMSKDKVAEKIFDFILGK